MLYLCQVGLPCRQRPSTAPRFQQLRSTVPVTPHTLGPSNSVLGCQNSQMCYLPLRGLLEKYNILVWKKKSKAMHSRILDADRSEVASARQYSLHHQVRTKCWETEAEMHPWAQAVGARFLEDAGHTVSSEACAGQEGDLPGMCWEKEGCLKHSD